MKEEDVKRIMAACQQSGEYPYVYKDTTEWFLSDWDKGMRNQIMKND